MSYYLIRIFLSLLLVLAVRCFWKKSNDKTIMQKMTSVIVMSFIVYGIFAMLPIEKYFVYFDAPGKAYSYSNTDDVYKTFEGKESALVLSCSNTMHGTTFSHSISPKHGDRWGICNNFEKDNLKQVTDGDTSVFLFNCKNTNDYYVLVIDMFANDALKIHDSANTEFECTETQLSDNVRAVSYYGYIESLDLGYQLFVDDQPVLRY